MNAFRSFQPTSSSPVQDRRSVVLTLPVRHVHRERDFGIGYGNSSGYASDRRYASNWAPPRFRFA
ncbi:MAG TPA: hypothetical protein VGD42_04560 [Lysobacter sp.]